MTPEHCMTWPEIVLILGCMLCACLPVIVAMWLDRDKS